MPLNVDIIGAQWAEARGIPVRFFPAIWTIGKRAGPLRNGLMADYAQALIAIWDGKSRGTADMLRKARGRNLRIETFEVEMR